MQVSATDIDLLYVVERGHQIHTMRSALALPSPPPPSPSPPPSPPPPDDKCAGNADKTKCKIEKTKCDRNAKTMKKCKKQCKKQCKKDKKKKKLCQKTCCELGFD